MKDNNQIVSLIIVNRDGMQWLPSLFASIRKTVAQHDYEVIVMDNASADTSLDFLEEQKTGMQLTVIKNEQNESFAKANNDAVKIAKGKYVVFCNNDIVLCEGWLNAFLDKYQTSDQKIGALGAKLIYPEGVEKHSGTIQHFGINFKRDEQASFCRPINAHQFEESESLQDDEESVAVTAALMCVEKEQFEAAGGFDERYYYNFEDVDLCLALREKGCVNIVCNKAIAYHHESVTQKKVWKGEHAKKVEDSIKVFKEKWEDKLLQLLYPHYDEFNQEYVDQSLYADLVATEAKYLRELKLRESQDYEIECLKKELRHMQTQVSLISKLQHKIFYGEKSGAKKVLFALLHPILFCKKYLKK